MEKQVDTVVSLINTLVDLLVRYGFQVLGGLVVLAAGWIVGGHVQRFVLKIFEERKVDVTVARFVASAGKFLVVGFAVVVALGKFGIEVAPLIAGISVAGFGLSFALQGPLSNYAAGATLIFTKPFRVGEIIEVAGVTGEVQDIQLPRTELKTVEGVRIIIPNKHIIGEVIHNYSEKKRLVIEVGVSYKADIDKAIRIVTEEITKDARVLGAPRVGIIGFGDSSVNLEAVTFCHQDDFIQLRFFLNKAIFDAFKAQGIEIPFPQRDVHLFNH